MDFVYQGKNPPTKLGAMASASNAVITSNQDPWLADSSTFDHLTANLNSLSNHSIGDLSKSLWEMVSLCLSTI